MHQKTKATVTYHCCCPRFQTGFDSHCLSSWNPIQRNRSRCPTPRSGWRRRQWLQDARPPHRLCKNHKTVFSCVPQRSNLHCKNSCCTHPIPESCMGVAPPCIGVAPPCIGVAPPATNGVVGAIMAAGGGLARDASSVDPNLSPATVTRSRVTMTFLSLECSST